MARESLRDWNLGMTRCRWSCLRHLVILLQFDAWKSLHYAEDTHRWLHRCMGHNRGWEEAASQLCGVVVELKTANAALLEAPGASWKEVRNYCACLSLSVLFGVAHR